MEEKKITSNDLIISLGSEDFRQYFRKNILPHLEPIEVFRAGLHKKKMTLITISIIVAVVITIVLFLINPKILAQRNGLECVMAIVLMPVGVAALAHRWTKKKFKETTGKRIIPTLFSYWGTFRYCDTPTYTGMEAFNLLKDLKVYNRHDNVEIDDCVDGWYNGLKLKITELDVSYVVSSGRSSRKVQVFDGLMMEVDMNKKFTSHTVIKPDRALDILIKGFGRVHLEDVEFEKIFDVYSTDQVEARYLLTTAFMRRLVELKTAKGKRVEAVFWNQTAYFFINYQEDMFELPLDKPVTDMKHYQNILLDLARMLRIVDVLKLEQDIGL